MKTSKTRPMSAAISLDSVMGSSSWSGQVEQKHFGVCAAVQRDRRFTGNLGGIAAFERDAVHANTAAGHMYVDPAPWCKFMPGRFDAVDQPRIDRCILMDRD